ncbi:MAG: hypothetical protein Q4C00_00675 [Bacillota bacterium]|nr:hypothetical protein [Bacillota bacterium]
MTEAELRDIYKKSPFTSFDLPTGMKLTPAASQFLSERKIKVLRDGVAESDLVQEDRHFNISAPTPAYPKIPPKPLPLSGNAGVSGGDSNVTSISAPKGGPPYGVAPAAVAAHAPTAPIEEAPMVSAPVNKIGGSAVSEDTTAEHMDRSHVSPEKPEHMTHLRGAELVPKTHPIIAFRGRLDIFEAVVLKGIISAEKDGFKILAQDLTELLEYSRKIMRAEVRQEPLEPINICGWDATEIRDRSHYPNKYYNAEHFTPQPNHGKIMADLNYMRAIAREMELAAAHAFYKEDGTTDRDDILQAVNRFSSVIYVFMLQLLAGEYKYGC